MDEITLTDRERAVLNEMSDERSYTFARLSEDTKIPADEVRLIVRSFAERGLAMYGPVCRSDDDYTPSGSGYWLTRAGYALQTEWSNNGTD